MFILNINLIICKLMAIWKKQKYLFAKKATQAFRKSIDSSYGKNTLIGSEHEKNVHSKNEHKNYLGTLNCRHIWKKRRKIFSKSTSTKSKSITWLTKPRSLFLPLRSSESPTTRLPMASVVRVGQWVPVEIIYSFPFSWNMGIFATKIRRFKIWP